MNERIADS